ncbi:MAG: hypothetical protein AAGM22_28935 [Acidobacteriota bacterium]
MPIYRHLYIEHRGDDGWGIPNAFAPKANMFHPELGQFAWVHPRAGWLDLFWSEDAIFPFQPGAPEERGSSPLLNHLKNRRDYGFDRNEDSLSWLPLTEMWLDSWQDETVLVGYPVEARWVPHFGDGNSPFPIDLLSDPDFKEDRDLRERARLWRGAPINGMSGADRFRWSIRPPHAAFNVTWRETIAELIGGRYAQLFTSLRDYGRDEDLRILSVCG